MTSTYTIPTCAKEDVEKILSRYQRKATAYCCNLTFEASEPYAKKRCVWEEVIDPTNGTTFKRKVGEELVEVYDLTIDGDIICKAGYTVVAKIEHLDGGNIVHTFGEGQGKQEWSEIKARCQHCGGRHGQKVTFIVRHEDGSELQVGRTCLKDYCGIDPKHIAAMNQLYDLILGEDLDHCDFIKRPAVPAYRLIDALALAIRVMREQGYVKSFEINSNSNRMRKLAHNNAEIIEADVVAAEKLAEQIGALDRETALGANLDNVQTLIRSGYCKFSHFGYIAYAPLAYQRYEEKQNRQRKWDAERQMERDVSEYIGEIGQRIEVELSDVKILTSWETQFGYTYLYKMTDTAGNILIWKTSGGIKEETRKIKATVKEHSERNGVKQTVVARCSAIAL